MLLIIIISGSYDGHNTHLVSCSTVSNHSYRLDERVNTLRETSQNRSNIPFINKIGKINWGEDGEENQGDNGEQPMNYHDNKSVRSNQANLKKNQVHNIDYEMNNEGEYYYYDGELSDGEDPTFDEKDKKWKHLKIQSDDVELLGNGGIVKQEFNENGELVNPSGKKKKRRIIVVKKRKPFDPDLLKECSFSTKILDHDLEEIERLRVLAELKAKEEEERLAREEEERKKKEEEERLAREEEERRKKEEEERLAREEEERRRKQEEEERKKMQEEDRLSLAVEERKKKEEDEERKRKEEEQERIRKEEEAERKRKEEEERLKKEEEDRLAKEEEERRKKEEEERLKKEEEERLKKEEEDRIAREEEERRKKEEEERLAKEEEERKKKEEEERLAREEEERKRKEEEDRLAREEAERKQKEEEELKKIQEEQLIIIQQRKEEEERKKAEEERIEKEQLEKQRQEEEQAKIAKEEQERKDKEEQRRLVELQNKLLEEQNSQDIFPKPVIPIVVPINKEEQDSKISNGNEAVEVSNSNPQKTVTHSQSYISEISSKSQSITNQSQSGELDILKENLTNQAEKKNPKKIKVKSIKKKTGKGVSNKKDGKGTSPINANDDKSPKKSVKIVHKNCSKEKIKNTPKNDIAIKPTDNENVKPLNNTTKPTTTAIKYNIKTEKKTDSKIISPFNKDTANTTLNNGMKTNTQSKGKSKVLPAKITIPVIAKNQSKQDITKKNITKINKQGTNNTIEESPIYHLDNPKTKKNSVPKNLKMSYDEKQFPIPSPTHSVDNSQTLQKFAPRKYSNDSHSIASACPKHFGDTMSNCPTRHNILKPLNKRTGARYLSKPVSSYNIHDQNTLNVTNLPSQRTYRTLKPLSSVNRARRQRVKSRENPNMLLNINFGYEYWKENMRKRSPISTKTSRSVPRVQQSKNMSNITDEEWERKRKYVQDSFKDPHNPYSAYWPDKMLNVGYKMGVESNGTINGVPLITLVKRKEEAAEEKFKFIHRELKRQKKLEFIRMTNHPSWNPCTKNHCCKDNCGLNTGLKKKGYKLIEYPSIYEYFN